MKKLLKQIFFSLAFLIIGLFLSLSPALVHADLCVGVNGYCDGQTNGGASYTTADYGLPDGTILGIAEGILFWLLSVFAILGVIGFLLAGIFYLLAGADEGNIEKGKNGMKYSIIGIIVGLSGLIVMRAVGAMLMGADNF